MTIARSVCACVCPVRQFNVQLYVEKVFIAQKTSEDRGGKVRKRVKDTELWVDFTGKGIGGGGAGWKVGGRDGRGGEDTSPDRVIIARQEKKRETIAVKRVSWNDPTTGIPSRMKRVRALAR